VTLEDPAALCAKIADSSGFNCFSNLSERKLVRIDPIHAPQLNLLPMVPPNNDPQAPTAVNLHVVGLTLDRTDQAETLKNIFEMAGVRLNNLISANINDAWKDLLIVIDNLASISDEAIRSAVDVRKNPFPPPSNDELSLHQLQNENENFFREIRQGCLKNKINTFLVFEEAHVKGIDNATLDMSMTAQAYAADITVRLGVESGSTGYRQRFIEILKAKNQFYYRGRHDFSIVSPTGGGRQGENPDEIGIVIYPSVATQLSCLPVHHRQRPKDLDLGIEPGGRFQVRPGSTTVLVSDMDLTATKIGLHFCRANVSPDFRALYISLFLKKDDIAEMLDPLLPPANNREFVTVRYFPPEHIGVGKLLYDIDKAIERALAGKEGIVVLDNVFDLRCKFPLVSNPQNFLAAMIELFRARGVTALILDTVEAGEGHNPIEKSIAAGLAENVCLLRHIEFQCNRRAVFSYVKSIGSSAKSPPNQTLDASLGNIPDSSPPEVSVAPNLSATVAQSAMDEDIAPAEPAAVFPQSSVTDAVSALQTQSGATTQSGESEHLWELEDENGRLIAKDTFALYKNVLSGTPEAIKFAITLYMDEAGSPFAQYLEGQKLALQQIFGDAIHITLYGPEHHARTQAALMHAQARPTADCHIVALDEFWLNELIKHNALEEIGDVVRDIGREASEPPIMANEFVTAAHDLALWHQASTKQQKNIDFSRWYALAERNNVGVLCCNPSEVRKLLRSTRASKSRWTDWLDRKNGKQISWDDLVALKRTFGKLTKGRTRARRQIRTASNQHPETFFTMCMNQIESCVSFLLELALSYSHPDSDPFRPPQKEGLASGYQLNFGDGEKPDCWIKALKTTFRLLDKEDIEFIAMRRFRASRHEPTSLFSRQWISTLGALRAEPNLDAMTLRKRNTVKARMNWFRSLEPFELPYDIFGTAPHPVSGAWYLGILRGGVAIREGVRLILNLTSRPDEVYKLNHYMALPVRKGFYQSHHFRELPYSERFAQLAELQKQQNTTTELTEADAKFQEIVGKRFPFYRTSIKDYTIAAPILWRLFVNSARSWIDDKGSSRFVELIRNASKEYEHECNAIQRGD